MNYCEVLSKTKINSKSEYILRMADGSKVKMDSDRLKEAVASGVIGLTNMRLTSDGKLVLFNYTEQIDKIKDIIAKKAKACLRRYKYKKELEWCGNNTSGFTLIIKVFLDNRNNHLNPAIITFRLAGADMIEILGRTRGTVCTSIKNLKANKEISTLIAINTEDAISYMNNI